MPDLNLDIGPTDHFCGGVYDHIPHTFRLPTSQWRISDIVRMRFGRRRCTGVLTGRCGRYAPHRPHWVGEHFDEICVGPQ
jgi:hypothetical protein